MILKSVMKCKKITSRFNMRTSTNAKTKESDRTNKLLLKRRMNFDFDPWFSARSYHKAGQCLTGPQYYLASSPYGFDNRSSRIFQARKSQEGKHNHNQTDSK